MCYNPEVSLTTFIFGCIVAIIIYNLTIEYRPLIIILLSFTSMQFLEFLAWTYYNNIEINRLLSKIGLFIIFIQMFLMQFLLLEGKLKKWSLIIFAFVAILFIIIQLPKINFKMKKGENKHLIWYWLDLPIYWIIIGLLFYLIPAYFNKYNNKFLFVFALITLIISLYFYYKYKTWGTMWCYISNILWIIFLLYLLIKK